MGNPEIPDHVYRAIARKRRDAAVADKQLGAIRAKRNLDPVVKNNRMVPLIQEKLSATRLAKQIESEFDTTGDSSDQG